MSLLRSFLALMAVTALAAAPAAVTSPTDEGDPSPAVGPAVHRVNAGGSSVAGTPAWSADTPTEPSPYVNAAAIGNTGASTSTAIDISHPSVPPGTPSALFSDARTDLSSTADMQWGFPVTSGWYDVRLYFAEITDGHQAAGMRRVDVLVEGGLALDNYDIFARVGGYRGVVETVTISSDATLDVVFRAVTSNPMISAIEIVPSEDPGPGAVWEARAATTMPRGEAPLIQVGGAFYLAGGGNTDPGMGYDYLSIERYDPAADQWARVSSRLPAVIHHVQAVEVGGLIYLIGSQGSAGWKHVSIYDPVTDTIRRGQDMPRPRGAGGVVVHEGRIYYAGGRLPPLISETAVAWFDVYDPATDTWSQLPDIPRVRDHWQGAIVDGKLYVIGGRNVQRGATVSETDVYDFATGQWSVDPPIPTPRGGVATAVLDEEIYVMGGETCCPNRVLGTVEVYDPRRKLWRSLPDMPTPRHGVSAAVCNGGIYLAGGSTTYGQPPGSASTVHEVLFPNGPTTCSSK